MTADVRVAFDHRIFVYQKHGGISRYFCGLTEELGGFGVTPKVIAPAFVTDRLAALPSDLRWGRHIRPRPRVQRAAQIAGEVLHASLARRFRADIVHETYFNARRAAPRGVPVVLTIYDMIHELFPQYFPGDNTTTAKRAAIARADRIVCISESARDDLLRFYPEAADRTSVIMLAGDQSFGDGVTAAEAVRACPFILYVGARGRYKNFIALAHAFARSRLPGEFVELVCVGGGRFDGEERGELERLGVADSVTQVDADDVLLARLYREAAMFVCPSLYEGFGIPALEAMMAGCPVVAMRASSLPEVCGDAAEYAEPGSIDSLVAAIETVALSPGRADAMRAAGLERARLFSWKRCAEETAAVYRSLV